MVNKQCFGGKDNKLSCYKQERVLIVLKLFGVTVLSLHKDLLTASLSSLFLRL